MPVGLDQVELAVVVGVQRGQAEAQELPGRRGQACGGRPVAEQPAAVVVVERGRLIEEVGDGQVETTVAVEIAAGNTHPGQVSALRVGRQPRLRRLIGEPKAAQVAEEVIRRQIVGHEHVDLAVVVEVGGDDAQAATVEIHDSGLRGHVDEPAAVVAKNVVRQRRECERTAIHIPRLGAFRILAEGRIRGVPLQIVADIEIEVAVIVEVGPGRRCGPVAVAPEPRLRCGVLEPASAQIAIQGVRPPSGDEEVGPAVVIVVAHGDAVAVAARQGGQAGDRGDVLESAVASDCGRGGRRTVERQPRGGNGPPWKA